MKTYPKRKPCFVNISRKYKASEVAGPSLDLHGLGYAFDAIYMYYHVYMVFPSIIGTQAKFYRVKREVSCNFDIRGSPAKKDGKNCEKLPQEE